MIVAVFQALAAVHGLVGVLRQDVTPLLVAIFMVTFAISLQIKEAS